MSVYAVHNELLAGAPEMLPRLYRPVLVTTAPSASRRADRPCRAGLQDSGADPRRRLLARLTLLEIRAGYTLRGETLDGEGQASLAAVQRVLTGRSCASGPDFQPAVQIVDDRSTGRARAEFADYEEPERRRQLVRLWLRDRGNRGYQA